MLSPNLTHGREYSRHTALAAATTGFGEFTSRHGGGMVERQHDAELILGILINVLRHCLGTSRAPKEVCFDHPKPADWQLHSHGFLAPVNLGPRTNALIFRNDWHHHRMPHRDLHAVNRLTNQLLKIGGGIGALSLLDQAKGEIKNRLPDGVPYETTIANAVGLRRWTLQRRLAEYGLSFSGIVDLVRCEFATWQMRQRYATILEIRNVLGYSEWSALSRAFRRGFGVSPQKYRAKSYAADLTETDFPLIDSRRPDDFMCRNDKENYNVRS